MRRFLYGFIRVIISSFAYLINCLCPLHKGLVLCWSFDGKQYGGNVKCISDYLILHSNFQVIWMIDKASKAILPENIQTVERFSLRKIILMNTAEFLITDNRTDYKAEFWHKRKGQKYIMTWHGGVGNKKIEGDAKDHLPSKYIQLAKKDSSLADLFISCSKFLTSQYRRAFWYNGEILKKGMPSYDLFYDKRAVEQYNNEVRKKLNINNKALIIIYAPTFRKDHSVSAYYIDWERIIEILSEKEKKDVYVLLKLHPGLLTENIDISTLMLHSHIINVSYFGDIYPLMCASDYMISDYSSSIFEFALLKRPGLIFASDYANYDRGYYFKWDQLPFPFASNQKQLEDNLKEFNISKYNKEYSVFCKDVLGLYEHKNASKAVADWMLLHSL